MAHTTRTDRTAPRLAALAALLADETRASFCLALLDGRVRTAGELARYAGVAPSTASEHLGKLVAGGVLAEERQGRLRCLRLADARIAQLVEDLGAHVLPADGEPSRAPRGLRAVSADNALARGRTCYDHLAGRIGIAITDAMTARGLLRRDTDSLVLTDEGIGWFAEAGIRLDRGARRPLVRSCLDWTERRPHLAGSAGAALCGHALDTGWCVRIGSGRAVRATPAGEDALRGLLGIEPATLR
ncbi:ArsR/SmtB family transcription factor [Streptomyces sp. DT24]|uniref:ArsR/SmtB family transcription factor n=1 Tax=unclassified Streptomyces TaxID=2593676 RepID=UPI0023B8DF5B|nr:winged helix-turn-helix domain-containing protein [Streptomyces sp. AM 4-1-1]WEH32682.1 winged helix-turn-helix domain-containing protein [Streptomyces sp. AM 4-1-1]